MFVNMVVPIIVRTPRSNVTPMTIIENIKFVKQNKNNNDDNDSLPIEIISLSTLLQLQNRFHEYE
jgi:hypothetical protein